MAEPVLVALGGLCVVLMVLIHLGHVVEQVSVAPLQATFR